MVLKRLDSNAKGRLLTLVFALILLSSSGVLATDAFAQLGPLVSVPSSNPTLSGVVNSALGTISGSVGVVLNNVQSTSGPTSASNQMILSNFTVGAGNDKLLVVGISANNNSVSSVTFNGVPLVRTASSFQNNDAEFWYMAGPGSSGDVVVTMAGPTSAVVGAYAFSGVDQSNPIPTTATDHATSAGNPQITITTKYPNSWVLDLPSIYGSSTLGSPTCTQQWNDNVSGAITGASSSRVALYPAVVTCNWHASSGDFWDDVAVEIKASGASVFSGLTNSTLPGPSNVNSTASMGITVYAHRIPADYWDPCFATTCNAGTGPGASMYIVLFDSSGNVVQTGFADENGYTFSGLNPVATYYVYPTDCDNCHGSTHDVVFQYWGDNHSSTRPRAAMVGANLDAWYSCTNNCAGGP
jgi:hypothetical protein